MYTNWFELEQHNLLDRVGLVFILFEYSRPYFKKHMQKSQTNEGCLFLYKGFKTVVRLQIKKITLLVLDNIPELPLTPKTLHNPGGLRTVAKQMSNTNSASGLRQKSLTKLVSYPSRIQGCPSPWTEVKLCPNTHLPRLITKSYGLAFLL